jgi:YesN/AraC family two-component response regulator
MEYAGELLRTTSLSVGDIAELSGYNDYFYFARFFKKHTGVTPTEYRNRF